MKKKTKGYSDKDFSLTLKKAGAKMDIHGVFGLFYGCLAAPELVMPSTYWKVIFGEDGGEFETMEEAENLTKTCMFLWNVLARWNPDKEGFIYPAMKYPRDAEGLKNKALNMLSFIEGFVKGLDLGNAGEGDFSTAGQEGIKSLAEISAVLKTYPDLVDKEADTDAADFDDSHLLMDRLLDTIGKRVDHLTSDLKRARMSVLEEKRHFATDHQGTEETRTEKVGRNEPCPCGSGKKYKKCCGLLH